MRRGINIRKKKKIISNKLNKKGLKFLIFLITIILICISLYYFFMQDNLIKTDLEKSNNDFSSLNENIPFSLGKIILFSSATAESGSINQMLSLNISQYCDICMYLNKISDENLSISELYINNISLSSPELGTPYIYKKSVSDLGKASFNEKNIINDRLNFNVINVGTDINYNNYEIYNDATTPISLGFYNKDIKTNYISNNLEILYNGSLLKDATIPLTSLNCNIAFTLNIVTIQNEHYICNVNFDIPLDNSIYDSGYIRKEFTSTETSKFIRIK